MGPTWHKLFQRCHQHFQHIEANIQRHTQLPSCNLPICMDELIEVFFISWCDSCAWLSSMWRVFHVAVATAEARHPLPQCANIHCLVSINIQEVSMNVIGCNFFCMEKFSYTPLLHMHFHVRRHLLDCPSAVICCTATKFNGLLAGRFNL